MEVTALQIAETQEAKDLAKRLTDAFPSRAVRLLKNSEEDGDNIGYLTAVQSDPLRAIFLTSESEGVVLEIKNLDDADGDLLAKTADGLWRLASVNEQDTKDLMAKSEWW